MYENDDIDDSVADDVDGAIAAVLLLRNCRMLATVALKDGDGDDAVISDGFVTISSDISPPAAPPLPPTPTPSPPPPSAHPGLTGKRRR